jgi:hypothetical protein
MTQDQRQASDDEPKNIHFASTKEDCKTMGARQGWTLKEAKEVGNGILGVKCIFEGEQTSFDPEGEE